MRALRQSPIVSSGLASAVLLVLGLAYIALPYDLIPDQSRFGLIDDVVFMMLCMAGALAAAPSAIRADAAAGARFRLRVLRADLGNFGLLQHRYVDGFLISGKNSGSHWVKYMLSLALAEQYGLPPPRFSSGRHADRIVGRASRKRCGLAHPQIATSHTIPSILLTWLTPPCCVRQPPVVLLVRDIPDALASGFRKWRHRYQVGLSTFAAGDPSGRRFIADVWWYAHFFNRWGALHRHHRGRVLLVRYEELLVDPASWLIRIAAHLRLQLDMACLLRAAGTATKDHMRAAQDPEAGETIVPEIGPPPRFSRADRCVIQDVLARFQRYDLGYDKSWPAISQANRVEWPENPRIEPGDGHDARVT